MARATFHKAADGHPARDAASWTEEKLMILDAYLNSFAKACRTAGSWYALDLFAGTGLNGGSIRVLFAFDPNREAVLLIGGGKTGHWQRWYKENIPIADALYDEYLEQYDEDDQVERRSP
jgi:hypothetical protein